MSRGPKLLVAPFPAMRDLHSLEVASPARGPGQAGGGNRRYFPLLAAANIRDIIRPMPAKHPTKSVYPPLARTADDVRQWLSEQQGTRKLRSQELAQAFAVSLRQLQWWDERRVVEPAHEGHTRQYTFEDAVLIGAIANLRTREASLYEVRKILRSLARGIRNRNFRFRRFAIVTKNEVTWVDSAPEACQLLATEHRRVWLVDLDRIADRLHERFSQ